MRVSAVGLRPVALAAFAFAGLCPLVAAQVTITSFNSNSVSPFTVPAGVTSNFPTSGVVRLSRPVPQDGNGYLQVLFWAVSRSVAATLVANPILEIDYQIVASDNGSSVAATSVNLLIAGNTDAPGGSGGTYQNFPTEVNVPTKTAVTATGRFDLRDNASQFQRLREYSLDNGGSFYQLFVVQVIQGTPVAGDAPRVRYREVRAIPADEPPPPTAVSVTVDTSLAGRRQEMDGFGTTTRDASIFWSGNQLNPTFLRYYDDLGASILRIDLVPEFKSPWSDRLYNSPNFGVGGQDGNAARTYSGPSTTNGPSGGYQREYNRGDGTYRAPIAVFGPDIDQNIALYVDTNASKFRLHVLQAQAGEARKAALGDFKLYGSVWSGPPWLKLATGNAISAGGGGGTFAGGPAAGTAWPFIWLGNFSGGKLDTTGTPMAEYNDSALNGGTGPTSALTQFARYLSTFLRAFQNQSGVQFHSISIQNELNFETFYNSTRYRLSSEYIAALKAVRAELDRHSDLQHILIQGPEDLMGGDAYSMYAFGAISPENSTTTHKNLRYVRDVFLDPVAADALAIFNIHGYAPDGVSSAGAAATEWDWWANGWDASPAPGLPSNLLGFREFPDLNGNPRKSWMTETSGESSAWLAPASGFPADGGWSIALKIHNALTTGYQSAWVYWQFAEGSGSPTPSALTDQSFDTLEPKYVAMKHYSKYIRPNSWRQETTSSNSALQSSAYLHDDGMLTIVLVNTATTAVTANITVPGNLAEFDVFTSSNSALWQQTSPAPAGGVLAVPVPAYGVATIVATPPADTIAPGLQTVQSRKTHG